VKVLLLRLSFISSASPLDGGTWRFDEPDDAVVVLLTSFVLFFLLEEGAAVVPVFGIMFSG
jgi:hypothetical protein